MFEQIRGVRRGSQPKQQTGGNETLKRRIELRLGLVHHGCQKRMRKLTANSGADLCDFLGRAEPIEARHQ